MQQRRQTVIPSAALDARESGFMLLAVVVMAALMLIALAVAAPIVAKDLRREKEVESAHRAQEYVRAIQLYQRACKCTGYPASMDALEKSTTVRFLRKRYVDPLTGKSDWRLIHAPKTTIKGFFGQELAGMTAGLGSAAGMASGGGSSPSAFGSSTPGGLGATGPGGSTTISAGGLAGGFNGATIGGSNGSTGSTGSGSSGSTGMFGDGSGGVIYGVGPNRTGESILTPNQQTTYETWEFWYDPRIELLKANVNILGGGGPAGASSSGGGGMNSHDATTFGGSNTPGSNNGGAFSAPGSNSNTFGNPGSGSGGTTNSPPNSNLP